MRSLLFGTTILNAWLLISVTVLMVAASAAASWFPAKKAALANPNQLLRSE
jgi:ABC-type lipoprotein release transport system permease subunit